MNRLHLYASQYLGRPYRWGENGIKYFDCSALVIKCLNHCGYDIPDMTAQMLHDRITRQPEKFGFPIHSEPQAGCILFFGKSVDQITHTAISVSTLDMIEAGGAGSESKMSGKMTDDDLLRIEATVRYRPITHRKDLVSSFLITMEN